MKITASINNKSINQINARIKQIGRNLENAKREIAQDEIAAAKTRITMSKTDPDGRPWAPWSLSTLRQRTRERNLARGLLYRTGRLLNSFKFRIDRNKIIIQSTAPYSGYLQRGRLNMRPRQILGFGRPSIERIKQRLKGAITK